MDSQTSMIVGNYVLIGCCAVYLVWWSIAFNPRFSPSLAPKVILFLATLVLGIVSIVMIVGGITGAHAAPALPNFVICVAGIAVYIVLLILSAKLFHRQVTTELILIVGWVVLQLCLVNTLLASGALPMTKALIACAVIVVMAIVGMVCYLWYYRLDEVPAFFIGMVPLVLFAISMLTTNLLAR